MITPPKTPKSNRKITIPPFLAEELKKYCGHLYGIMPNERMFRFTKSYMEHEIVRGIKETGVRVTIQYPIKYILIFRQNRENKISVSSSF